jgi:hypothetical protein
MANSKDCKPILPSASDACAGPFGVRYTSSGRAVPRHLEQSRTGTWPPDANQPPNTDPGWWGATNTAVAGMHHLQAPMRRLASGLLGSPAR